MSSKGVKHRKSKKKKILYQAQQISNEKGLLAQDVLSQLKASLNNVKPVRKRTSRKNASEKVKTNGE